MSMADPESDTIMMRRCIALAQCAGKNGEYPFAAVIARRGEFICESLNMVKAERDITRHAEMVAMASAQKKLRATSLDDCTLYSTVEPCAMCSYAIRETRIGRVVFGLRSPLMGGHSQWKVLTDSNLSSALPEVFARPPVVLSGYLQHDVQTVFRKRNPLTWQFIKARKIFVESPDTEHVGVSYTKSRIAPLVQPRKPGKGHGSRSPLAQLTILASVAPRARVTCAVGKAGYRWPAGPTTRSPAAVASKGTSSAPARA